MAICVNIVILKGRVKQLKQLTQRQKKFKVQIIIKKYCILYTDKGSNGDLFLSKLLIVIHLIQP